MLVWKDKKGEQMVRRNFTAEQIINKLREAEIHINQGISISEASRKIGVTQQTYYRWRKEYGGLRIEQAKRLKSLEKENTRLKKLVADLSLDNAILKEVVGETSKPVQETQSYHKGPGEAWCFTETGMHNTRPGKEDAEAYTSYY
jgi:transposase-like protein